MRWPWQRRETAPIEKRASASGFTAEIMAAREAYVAGRSGLAELTATAQTCISMWESGLAVADVDGTDLLNRRTLALMGRSLALRGEALYLIRDDGLVPCSDWDLNTRNGRPFAYRISISEAGGGTTRTALAAEMLHVRIGSDPVTPWTGTAPMRRASLSAGLLQSIETALAEVYEHAPISSQIVPFPEAGETDLETLGRGFRGRRGRVLLRESVAVTAAGGPSPATDWRPQDVTPDLSKAAIGVTLDAARSAICGVFGVLPGLLSLAAQGPMVREAQRHLALWTLAPIAALIAEEASEKLGGDVTVDPVRPLQAWDSGGRARTVATLIEGLAKAKEAGLTPGDVGAALRIVDWE